MLVKFSGCLRDNRYRRPTRCCFTGPRRGSTSRRLWWRLSSTTGYNDGESDAVLNVRGREMRRLCFDRVGIVGESRRGCRSHNRSHFNTLCHRRRRREDGAVLWRFSIWIADCRLKRQKTKRAIALIPMFSSSIKNHHRSLLPTCSFGLHNGIHCKIEVLQQVFERADKRIAF